MISASDAIRIYNKRVLNPAMLRLAGRKHWYASVIRHTGRHSGKAYATPVVAEPMTDGFVVPLPYGTGVDWLRNVLTAGRATIQVNGQTYNVIEPKVVDAATAAPLLSARRRRLYDRFAVHNYLRLRLASAGDEGGGVEARDTGENRRGGNRPHQGSARQ